MGAYKQSVRTELVTTQQEAKKQIEKMGDSALDQPNTYFTYFKHGDAPEVSKEHEHTFDRVNDNTTYDQNVPRDTFHTRHTESARKGCKVALHTARQVRSSQTYGWLPAVDFPNYGHGRSSIFLDSSMDKSHLGSGPWSAR